ncbi:MAG: hypothetical protein K0Q97_269 [Bacillota bacterium]|jgi:hybrid cluster-associated redox disulfide protein|nr:hypothetical protein [Bacillota bacterium]
MTVIKETLIKDIVSIGPEAIKILLNFGMGCFGCPSSQYESIEDAAVVHGINVDNLINALNNIN